MKFEDYSWHDNPIHGFKIIESDHGSGNLELDIDYISEWLRGDDNFFNFKIAPATLVFEGITDLEIALDYKSCSAGITPPSIHEIVREQFSYQNGYSAYAWHIVINWPSNAYIKFKANSFTQTLRREPIIHNEQVLPAELRV